MVLSKAAIDKRLFTTVRESLTTVLDYIMLQAGILSDAMQWGNYY